MNNIETTNEVKLEGKITEKLKFDHESHGRRFYSTYIKIVRYYSKKNDVIPIIIPATLLRKSEIQRNKLKNKYVRCKGQFRSHNIYTECKDSEEAKKYPKGRKLQLRLFMYVEEIEIIDKPKKDKNYIFLDGYLCREPAYRKIKDENKDEYFDRTYLMLAVSRGRWNADFIPCVTWNRNARFTANLPEKKHIICYGEIHNREYFKKNEEKDEEQTVYEVLVIEVYAIDD